MRKIPGLIIKSIFYLKIKQKSLDRTTDFKGRKSVSSFSSFFFLMDLCIWTLLKSLITIFQESI